MRLFTSFSGLLHDLAAGRVSDLTGALFFFGCARSHALAPWEPAGTNPDGSPYVFNEITKAFRDEAEGLRQHARIVAEILRGEAEGRVVWIKNEAGERINESAALTELLAANGIEVPANVSHCRNSAARFLEMRAAGVEGDF